ncbi:ABC transporter substrate-binding protein [Streptomyces sp. NPDC006307]|uniref:ABC transporter substrate-binding protein n=1 Tax=Streptomyces sp. NPDC006307 TaxID=3156748 RepID=UPI0033B70F6D
MAQWPAAEAGTTPDRLRIGLVAEVVVCLPLWIAESEGLLAAQGLTVEHHVIGSTDGVTDALRAGEVDFALTTPEGVLMDRAAGGPLRILAGVTNHPPLSLVAQPGCRTVSDLRGRVLGTSSLTEGTRHLVDAVLAAHGLRHTRDYRFMVVGNHTERWRLLQDGTLTAALQPLPFDAMATDAGLTCLAQVDRYVPHAAFLSICADTTSAACRAGAVGFLRALSEGARRFHSAPARYEQLTAQRLGITRHYAGTAITGLVRRDLIDPRLHLTTAALRGTAQLLVRAGRLDAAHCSPQALATAVDDRWLAAARGERPAPR